MNAPPEHAAGEGCCPEPGAGVAGGRHAERACYIDDVWAVGVLCGDGDRPAECVDRLCAGGWAHVRVFANAGTTLPPRFLHEPATVFDAGLPSAAREVMALSELVLRYPEAEAYLLLRRVCVLGNAARWLSELRSAAPPAAFDGVVVLACGASDGRWRPVDAHAEPAPDALLIFREAALTLLSRTDGLQPCTTHDSTPAAFGSDLMRLAASAAVPLSGFACPWLQAEATTEEAQRGAAPSIGRISDAEVTIVVPTWNCAEYLRPCLDSLRRQTLAAQIVVVDDASSDETPTVLREYAPEVTVLRHAARRGANAARNTGVSATRVSFVAFADADNEYKPDWLATLLDAAVTRPDIGVAYCNYTKLFEDGAARPVESKPWDHTELWFGNYIDMPSVVRRAALPAEGLAEGFAPFDDWRLWLAMAEAGWTGRWVARDLYLKQVRSDGKTRQSFREPHARAREVALLRRRYARLPGIERPLAVVIPAHGCEDLTVTCLEHLAAYCGAPSVIYYVDNGSPAGAVTAVGDAAERLGLQLLTIRNSANRGFTAAVNQGLAAAGDLDVLVLNNDCFIGPGAIEWLWRALRAEPRVAAAGPLTGDDGRQSLRYEERCFRAGLPIEVLDELDDPVRVALRLKQRPFQTHEQVLAFFCVLLRRAALRACGPLDERFESGLGADDEWCLRAGGAGWQAVLSHNAYVTHLHRSTFDRLRIDRDAQQREAKLELARMLEHGASPRHARGA
jgi:GT2 family glycosyltransferase